MDAEGLLYLGIVLVLLFAALRFRHYLQMRDDGHDEYIIAPDGQKRCPNMSMFGFKFSVILALVGFNLILTVYLIAKSR